jgi:hypothetical protein
MFSALPPSGGTLPMSVFTAAGDFEMRVEWVYARQISLWTQLLAKRDEASLLTS